MTQLSRPCALPVPKTRQSSRSRELHALERGAVHAHAAAARLMELMRVPGERLATDAAEIDPASLREHHLTVALPRAASAASAARRATPRGASRWRLQVRCRPEPAVRPGQLGPRPLESRL